MLLIEIQQKISKEKCFTSESPKNGSETTGPPSANLDPAKGRTAARES